MADETFKVASDALKMREYDGKGGKRVVWGYMLEGKGQVEHHLNPGEDPPAKDTEVTGEVKEQEFQDNKFLRFFPEGSGSGGRGGGNYERSADHPTTTARMNWTASLGTATTVYDQLRTEGILPKAEKAEDYKKALMDIAAWVNSTYPGKPNHPVKGDDDIPF